MVIQNLQSNWLNIYATEKVLQAAAVCAATTQRSLSPKHIFFLMCSHPALHYYHLGPVKIHRAESARLQNNSLFFTKFKYIH